MMQILKPSIPDMSRFLAELEPNDNTTEFINGAIHQKQIPKSSAVYLQAQLWNEINATTDNSQQAIAYPNHRCSFGGWSVVLDLAVFLPSSFPLPCVDSEITPNINSISSPFDPIHARYPDWMIEILLPEQEGSHALRTVLHCLAHGTQMAWIIDLNHRLTFVFAPHQTPCELRGRTILPTPAEFDLELTVETILGWIPSNH